MKIVLASGNKGKIQEIKSFLPNFEVIPYSDILGDFEVIEDENTFKGNAIKKVKEIYDAIADENIIVIADDSGLSVPILDHEPGIYSARYAGVGVTDKENNIKLIEKLKKKDIQMTSAYYTASIAMIFKGTTYTTHGWMHGHVITEEKGNGGFGYDPLFIPKGYSETLGMLEPIIKKELSHRIQALKLMYKYLEILL